MTRTGAVWGIARVKDEQDIITSTVRWMLSQCDYVLVCDNNSQDGTRDLLADLQREAAGTLLVYDDADVAYYQSEKMSQIAAEAQEMGARWVVPFDADEIWVAPGWTLAEQLRNAPDRVSVIRAELFDHVATGEDPAVEDPVARITWRRRTAGALPKVAARTRPRLVIHQGNHDADYGHTIGGLVVHHFPYRSAEQMIRKARNGAAAYAATNLPEDVGKHWRDYGRLTDEQITETFQQHFWTRHPTGDLVQDPAPCLTPTS